LEISDQAADAALKIARQGWDSPTGSQCRP
jgi:hypothetical protein